MSSPLARRIGRRDFLGIGAASLSSAWLFGCEKSADVILSPLSSDPSTSRGGSLLRNPLKIPSVASASGLTLTAAPGTANLGGSSTSNAWMYNGEFPGPSIIANSGSTATVHFVNGLAQDSITHWHGMIVDYADDGHPREAVGDAQAKSNGQENHQIIAMLCIAGSSSAGSNPVAPTSFCKAPPPLGRWSFLISVVQSGLD